jgi:transposase
MNSKSLEAKRHFINGKTLIGIDPAKLKHQAIIIDSIGVPVGSTFKFSNNFFGFHTELFNNLVLVKRGMEF